jgi:phosphoglycolate phosphatase-like HAD superfamily hydrolase
VSAPLPAWRDTPTRQAIIDFVERVTTKGHADHVPPEERIAVFDNDGTLWCEKPIPVQLGFLLERFAAMALADPSLLQKQPWKASAEKDYGWLGEAMTKHYHGDDSDVKLLVAAILQAFAGSTVDEYTEAAHAYLHDRHHPTLARPYPQTGYVPMIELLAYLEANGFTNYIASGGDRDFMRPVTERMYGIPGERVIGSSNGLRYLDDEHGGSVTYAAEMDVFDDGPIKPVRIWSRVGRRPIIAGGNSNGDIPMLRYAGGRGRPALRLLVLHDDADREFDYTAGAEKSLQQAAADAWTVVSVKDDWHTVFTDEPGTA